MSIDLFLLFQFLNVKNPRIIHLSVKLCELKKKLLFMVYKNIGINLVNIYYYTLL